MTTVVVVEPDADNGEMYQTFLELSGCEACVVETAGAALARLRVAPRPQAVVFDFVLPDMRALDFCGAMEALIGDDGPALRRVVVTGWPVSMADREALIDRGGITDIYEKPCDLDVLLRALRI